MLHAPPFRVHQDILHESHISHIRCIYLKRIQNELLNFFPRQGLFTSFSHSLVLVKFQYSAWLFFICVFQTDFCTIFTSFAVRATQPRVPHSVYCTLVPCEITFISTFLSTLCTTSTVKVSPMSCFSTNNLITLYNHFITISAGSELKAPKLLPRPH